MGEGWIWFDQLHKKPNKMSTLGMYNIYYLRLGGTKRSRMFG